MFLWNFKTLISKGQIKDFTFLGYSCSNQDPIQVKKKKKNWNQDFKRSSLQILNQCFIETSRLKSPKVASIQVRVFTFFGYNCSNQNPNQVIEKKEAQIKSSNLQHSSQVRLEALVCKYKYSKASQFGISFLQFLNWQLLWRKTQEIHFFFSPKRQ